MTRVMAQEDFLCYTGPNPPPEGVGERKELIVVKENIIVGIVSALVGLAVGFLVWGASASWGFAPPATMNGMGGQMMGLSMMNGMMGGMMQGMGQMGSGMMNQPSPNHNMMGDMNEHMAQCHQMMGSMMGMMQQQMQMVPQSK